MVVPQQQKSPGDGCNRPGAMAEALEGYDMTHFIVWVYASWAAIIAAALIGLYLPVYMNPKPKIVAPAPAPTLVTKPGATGFWKTPKHTPVDWREPLNGEDNELVRPYCAEDEVFFFATRLGLPDPAHWLDDVTAADRVLTGAGVAR